MSKTERPADKPAILAAEAISAVLGVVSVTVKIRRAVLARRAQAA